MPNPIQPIDPKKLRTLHIRTIETGILSTSEEGEIYQIIYLADETMEAIQLLAQEAVEKAKSEFLIINTDNFVSPPHNFNRIDPGRTEE